MQYAADEQAASQIERLFHAPDCMVWELIDAPALPDKEDLPIHRADGVLVGLARRLPRRWRARYCREPSSPLSEQSRLLRALRRRLRSSAIRPRSRSPYC